MEQLVDYSLSVNKNVTPENETINISGFRESVASYLSALPIGVSTSNDSPRDSTLILTHCGEKIFSEKEEGGKKEKEMEMRSIKIDGAILVEKSKSGICSHVVKM